jgi:uncharacterized protein YndB with AHSA1/START domain
MSKRWVAAAAALQFSSPVAAEVKSSSAAGFEVQTKVTVAASAADAYVALSNVGGWWNPEHTYSGKGENLSLEPRAGGCFCEKLDGGGTVEHMRVVYAQPGQVLRLQGGLGPLQAQAVAGTLTWTLKPAMNGTEVSQSYIVGGYIPGGAEKLAPLVDKVLAEQLQRLQRKLGAGR